MKHYQTLEKVFTKLNDIKQAEAILRWDMATMMPPGGAQARAEQLATLGSISHAILTDPGIEELIREASNDSGKLGEWQKANLREMERTFKHAHAVPTELLKELTREGSKCEMVWREARGKNDFKSFAPYLEKVVKLVRQIATHKGQAFRCTPYDALIDQYDPGRTTKQLDVVFDDLQEFLPGFIAQVVEKQKSKPAIVPLKGPFPVGKQKEISHKIMEAIGFDLNRGRFDESIHPFCGGYPGDIRITTRYDEDDFTSALMGVAHEAGHAMYEAGLPEQWKSQPVGHDRGMSMHESQSLLIEMQACRSKAFLKFLLPVVKKAFAAKGKGWSQENFERIYTHVEPSFIRVDADEVTYPAHIMLRYRIEKYLIGGEMEVEDLPEAWSQGMEKFLGITPKDDKDGCMQDIHWTDGSFGYFPSYTLGAMYAAQFFAAAKKADGTIPAALEKGDFTPLKSWLAKNIHQYGCLLSTDELLKKATGSTLDVNVYKEHLKARYL